MGLFGRVSGGYAASGRPPGAPAGFVMRGVVRPNTVWPWARRGSDAVVFLSGQPLAVEAFRAGWEAAMRAGEGPAGVEPPGPAEILELVARRAQRDVR